MAKEKDNEVKHWADQIADEAIERVENDPFLKKIVEKNSYFVYDEKTPSGVIHIGSGRGWIIHDAIAKALRSKGKKARFVLSSDDMDPLDKYSKVLSKEDNERYIGVPFRYIPSPVNGYDNFGDYYFKQVTEKFAEFGIEAELESTGEEYEKGTFNKQIKIILDNAGKVQDIFSKLYGEDVGAANKLPFNVRCPKCGKIATTEAIEWNKEKEELYFECKSGVVEWADGCGHKGWISPYNGNGKFPWKVEWAAKWPAKGVIVETAGKDHFTKGGSRTVACRIAVDVLDYPPPYPSKGYYTGPGYEFFTVGGKKMSTSKGRGIGFCRIYRLCTCSYAKISACKDQAECCY
jgi:lysyl-tRNA synthetase, class I